MCKSKAEGGQRCYSHARRALAAALAVREQSEARNLTGQALHAIEGRILRAQLELASTDQGRQDLLRAAQDMSDSGEAERAARIGDLIERGLLIEERNRLLALAPRAASAAERTGGSWRLSADDARYHLSRDLSRDEAARIMQVLDDTLYRFFESSSQSKRGTLEQVDSVMVAMTQPELRADAARREHSRAGVVLAWGRWDMLRRFNARGLDDVEMWREFIALTRHARDNPPESTALVADFRRDCNFVLRVCAEIAATHSTRVSSSTPLGPRVSEH